MKISKLQAMAFLSDVIGSFAPYGDRTATTEKIAGVLGIPTKEAWKYLEACKKYKLTERINGAWAI